MAFQLSPGVNVSELDLTTIVPSVATSIGAFAGNFAWGPVEEVVTISDEVRLVERFGKPNTDNYEYWFSAANFLAYSNNLKVVRAHNLQSTFNAAAIKRLTGVTITANGTGYSNATVAVTAADQAEVYSNGTIDITVDGNGNVVSASVNTAGLFRSDATLSVTLTGGSSATLTFSTTANTVLIKNETDYGQSYSGGANTYGEWAAKYAGALGNTLKISMADANTFTGWAYESQFTDAPATSSYATGQSGSNDELHIVVVDEDGVFTGSAGTILEKYAFVSKASDAKTPDGSSNYYKNVINNRSNYFWWLSHPKEGTNWGSAASGVTFANLTAPITLSMSGGADGTITQANVTNAYTQVSNPDSVDISLIITGPVGNTVVDSVISIAETRKDCVVFISPEKDDVVDNNGSEATDILAYRNTLTSSSYAVMDSGWKYQYDKYNDVYRWIPLNGDIAGLCARTDLERDPWFSPGGLNRGIVKNVIKLAYNPTKADRDSLYLKGVNPVVTFQGEGTILFGDKTMLSRPSVFDRINVRRLFIVLEKAISRASRSSLFEFNDQFTRAQFVSLIEPYLRDVQGRRGITDFRVVCDETNNTPEIIDRNEFVGDIYIKPSRSVNFIQLNFVAVRTGVNFEEIVGRF